MSLHTCTVQWSREGAAFIDNRYPRAHQWKFDGGAVVPGSSSPLSVPLPYSDASAVDPEEAFVAAVSSCHMLWFLSLAAARGFRVDSYTDDAEAHMTTIGEGRKAITRVQLKPQLVFSGDQLPTDADVESLHHEAHERCYIANSIRSDVQVAGAWRVAG